MQFDRKSNELNVVENKWKKAVERFPGALALPKYGMWGYYGELVSFLIKTIFK